MLRTERFTAAGCPETRLYTCNTAIVGSGAAGYNAADRLWKLGQRDILLLTERRTAGTSRNTGSDKQTYYKLTLAGNQADSVREMAETLFSGQCVDGDLALCEAALSTQCFFRLTELGVQFPQGRYGEYVGYKTDHDPYRRATSAGPYTSRQMAECLEAAVMEQGIPILDHMQVIRILTEGTQVLGLLCLDSAAENPAERFVLIHCKNVIFATGGPAGIYADSVYPVSQYGATGLALEAGVTGNNLTEWQYGLASVRPRWNVSGSYMQALPRMYSTETDGSAPREFLLDFFGDSAKMLNLLFLKGYQWPFDVRKLDNGSSIIDILVYLETCRGRRVFLDYRKNPAGEAFSFDALGQEAGDYLRRAGACLDTPYDRLAHMNQPAIDFYRDKGVDLAQKPLEIALCAQHNNGGLSVNAWWQSNLEGFFVVGEAAGTHGVYRPGGTALNAGQVGSLRAAQYIAARRQGMPEAAGFHAAAADAVAEMDALAHCVLRNGSAGNVRTLWRRAGRRMSCCGGAIRNAPEICAALAAVQQERKTFTDTVTAGSEGELAWVYRLREMLICQEAYLAAMAEYAKTGGKSRGSALYSDPSGRKSYEQLPDSLRFALDDGSRSGMIQEVQYVGGVPRIRWRPVRPIPTEDDFFENIWRSYRSTGNIDP